MISEPKLVTSKKYADDRGYFVEFNLENIAFTGTNLSISEPGVLRGMHTFRAHPQGKLVRCLSGHILDMIIDYRPLVQGDVNYNVHDHTLQFRLRDPEIALWVPPGFLHGFLALEKSSVLYHVTGPYRPELDYSVNPLDPLLSDLKPEEVRMSNKDRSGKSWGQFIQDVRSFSLS